jgi:DNA-binding winged helix-turn-helix (wHTH) protein
LEMLKPADLAGRPDFVVGPLRVSPARRLVEGPGGSAHLEPIVMKVFLLLLDAGGAVVTRDELFGNAWGGVFVGDDSLNRAVAQVRKIASETAPGLFEIETIPRTGYRLTGEFLDQLAADSADAGAGLSRRQLVAGGIVVAAAAAGAGMWLRERTASDAKLDDLLERGGATFRRDTSEDALQAITLLKEAVALRPRSARAWGLLACAYVVSSSYAPPEQASGLTEAAQRAARKGLQLEPHEPNAEAALVTLEQPLQDHSATDAQLRDILHRDPNNAYAMEALVSLLQGAGYTRESWTLNERALAVEPFAPVPLYRRGLKLWIMGQTPRSDKVIDRARELWPSHPTVWNARFLTLAFTGRAPAAAGLLDDEDARPKTLTSTAVAVWRTALAALGNPSEANVNVARAAILDAARLSPGLSAYGAMIMSALGDVDSAFRIIDGFLLSKGTVVQRPTKRSRHVLVNNRGWRETQWLWVPPTARLRADPRFLLLCRTLGLVAYWDARGIRPDYQLA